MSTGQCRGVDGWFSSCTQKGGNSARVGTELNALLEFQVAESEVERVG